MTVVVPVVLKTITDAAIEPKGPSATLSMKDCCRNASATPFRMNGKIVLIRLPINKNYNLRIYWGCQKTGRAKGRNSKNSE